MSTLLPIVNLILGTALAVALYHALVGHFESGNPGHSWKSTVIVFLAPSVLGQLISFAANQFLPMAPGVGTMSISFFPTFALGAFLMTRRYRIGWGYAAALNLGIAILAGLTVALTGLVVGTVIHVVI